jgi:hypothetical protein
VSQQVEKGGRGRRQLVLLILLFLLPPAAAWVAWQYLGEHGVGATTNNGTLISPARPLDLQGAFTANGDPLEQEDFAGRWLYVVYGNNGCDQACQQQLYVTRQTRVAVNKDTPRVRRLLVLDGAPDESLAAMLAAEHKDLLVAVTVKDELRRTFQGESFDTRGGQFFLVDPLGNLMMFYQADAEPRGVLRDLQKLLKISQVG